MTARSLSTISFIIHNFMDACSLERERIEACVFKTVTAEGPISMCMHNAKRDDYILKPVTVDTEHGKRYWQPLNGTLEDAPLPATAPSPAGHPLKRLKGRTRQQHLATRHRQRTRGF